MKTICFYNRKGGTGKTTTVVNVGGCLEKFYKKKVLIVDCDTQCNTTDYLLSEDSVTKTLYDYLNGDVSNIDDITYSVHFEQENHCKLKVIPASPYIDSLDKLDNYALKRLLNQVEDKYDYCLIDCTPYLSPLTLMGFCASRYIVTITELDVDSMKGYSLLIDEINKVKEGGYNDTLEMLGMVVNKAIWNDKVGLYIHDNFKEIAHDSLFKSTIRNARIMKQARFFGKPVCYYQPSAEITTDYKKLTKEIMERIGK